MSNKIWAVLPAAGTGQRMSASLPKQYLLLDGMPIAQRAIESLAASKLCEAFVVVLRSDDQHFKQQVLPVLDHALAARLQYAAGGVDRAASVLAGLETLAAQADDNDWVLVHDIARPLVSAADVLRLYQQVSERADDGLAGGILATPIHDTIKRAARVQNEASVAAGAVDYEVAASEDRSLLWAAQTPQMFRYATLRDALCTARDNAVTVTDEAMAIERIGGRVLLVASRDPNIKITTDLDLAQAGFLLSQESGAN